jgi:cellulose 1,4-beta-cellobiosidase
MVINSDLSSCRAVGASYLANIPYAIRALNLPNVIMYLDAGHGGSLGWDSNLKAGAAAFADVYKIAGGPSQVRGFATNVAGWNSW